MLSIALLKPKLGLNQLFGFALIMTLFFSVSLSPAFAQEQVAPQQSFVKFVFDTVFFVVLCAFIWFLLVTRPREQAEVEKQDFLTNLKKGEKVLVNGALIGKVSSLPKRESEKEKVPLDSEVEVDFGGNQKVKVLASSVSAMSKAADAKDSGSAKSAKK